MKRVALIVLVFFCVRSFAQGNNIKHQIDSLKQEIATAKHDTLKLEALVSWDYLIYASDPKLDRILNKRVARISRRNLKNQKFLSERERRTYMRFQALALNNLGIYYQSDGQNEKSIVYYEKSLAIKRKLGAEKSIANSLSNIGTVYFYQTDFVLAEQYYLEAFEIDKKLGDMSGVAADLLNLSSIYQASGDPIRAINNLSLATRLFEKMGDEIQVALCTNNMSSIYQTQGEIDKAIECSQSALATYQKADDKRGMAMCLVSLGNLAAIKEDSTKALNYLNEGLEISESAGIEFEMAGAIGSLAHIYQAKGDFLKAIELFDRVLVIREGNTNIGGMANAQSALGLLYLELGQLTLAKQYAKDAKENANLSGAIKESISAYFLDYRIHQASGKDKLALESYQRYILFRDSVSNVDNKNEIIRHQFRTHYEKQAAADSIRASEKAKVVDAELAAEQAENGRREQQSYFLYAGLLLALVFGGFIFNRFKLTQRQNEIIEVQKSQVEEKNQEIVDSITYARRIQTAILPPANLMQAHLPHHFIFYQPKDIVAGDFYWLEPTEHGVLVAAADCTGHGVPGAMVSVICHSNLNRAVREYGLKSPADILDKTRSLVVKEFEKSVDDVYDGMDIALCKIEGNKVEFAGAHNPLWIVRSGTNVIEECKGNKQPIGKYDKEQAFTNHEFDVASGDMIYIFSDGFADQFGGERRKKYKTAKFKELLSSLANEDVSVQQKKIADEFKSWRGTITQLDDVCVIGIRI